MSSDDINSPMFTFSDEKVNGGKDSAEQKETKCLVFWEGRTPLHVSEGGFNSPIL